MTKIGIFLCGLMLMAVTSWGASAWHADGTLTGGVVTDNTTVTITFPTVTSPKLNSWLKVPTINSASIVVSGTYDGTNFFSIYDDKGAAAKVVWTVAATTGGYVVPLPNISGFLKIKITCGAAQAANRAFVAFGN